MKVKNKDKVLSKDEFRKLKIGRKHKSWVFEKQGHNLKSFEITHTAEYYGKKNIPLSRNPDPTKQEKAYFIPEQVTANEQHYGRKYKDYWLPKRDKDKMRKHRKKT
jgi:hypothetical protein